MQKLILSVIVSLGLLAVVWVPRSVLAFDVINDPGTCTDVASSSVCNDSTKPQDRTNNAIYGPDGILTKAVTLVSVMIGIASVVALMFGGFKYITSAGEANKAASAKNTVFYALAGVLTALFAQGIILFVLDKL